MSVNSYKLNHSRRINESLLVATESINGGHLWARWTTRGWTSQTHVSEGVRIFFQLHGWKKCQIHAARHLWSCTTAVVPDKLFMFEWFLPLAIYNCSAIRVSSGLAIDHCSEWKLHLMSLFFSLLWTPNSSENQNVLCMTMTSREMRNEQRKMSSICRFFFVSSISAREMFDIFCVRCIIYSHAQRKKLWKCRKMQTFSSLLSKKNVLIVNQVARRVALKVELLFVGRFPHLTRDLTWGIQVEHNCASKCHKLDLISRASRRDRKLKLINLNWMEVDQLSDDAVKNVWKTWSAIDKTKCRSIFINSFSWFPRIMITSIIIIAVLGWNHTRGGFN